MRINVPNLFILVGQPDQGKTTCAKWFNKLLGCKVIHTDNYYHEWLASNHPSHVKAARRNIRSHWPTLKPELQRAWNEYITSCILRNLKRAKLDLVAEGWLLLHLPDDLKDTLARHANILNTTMQRFTAKTKEKTLRAQGKDYSNVVYGLCSLMTQTHSIKLMRNRVKYQSFEDLRDFQGSSDSCGILLGLNLPTDLTNKTVLDVGCSTGYFSIRCAQRGATVVGIDKNRSSIVTASRLANSVYRRSDIRFYHEDFFTWQKNWKFDYVLAIDILHQLNDDLPIFFDRIKTLLTPDGQLIVHTPINRYPTKQSPYPTEATLKATSADFDLVYRGRSISSSNKRRRVYHLINTSPSLVSLHEDFCI